MGRFQSLDTFSFWRSTPNRNTVIASSYTFIKGILRSCLIANTCNVMKFARFRRA